jgi:flagellar hook-associated protein 3 FlgL
MSYVGDSGASSVPLNGGTSVQTGDPGSAVYMNVPTGNGTFTTAASASNTGTGVIDTGSVTNQSAWVPGQYTITFSDASDYTVTDGTGATVATGTYNAANGGSVAFDGVQVGITGAPAAGDTFTVTSSSSQSVFDTLDNIVSALNNAGSSGAARAQLGSMLGGSLQQIDQALNQVSTVTTNVASRIGLISSTANSLTSATTTLASQISNLSDLDYAQAASQFSQQSLALQAAEQTYAAISQLSLFKFL